MAPTSGGGAGVVGHRALAAELEQAPALACPFVVEGLCELALIVEGATVAAVVDTLAVEHLGPALRVEFRQRGEGEEVRQHAGDDHRDRRAARHVHHRLVLDDGRDRHGAGRIRQGGRQAAVGRATADRDHRCRTRGGLLQHLQVADAGDGGVARIAERNRAVHHQQVLAEVLAHGRLAGGFGRLAGSGLQRVVVVERDLFEDQPFDRGRVRAGERLGAAGAFLEGEPDHRGPPGFLQRRGDGRHHRGRQRHEGGGGGAELEEAAPADALPPQDLGYGRTVKRHGRSHNAIYRFCLSVSLFSSAAAASATSST